MTWLRSSKTQSRGGSNNIRFRKGCLCFVTVSNRPKKRHTRDKVKQSTCRLKAPLYGLYRYYRYAFIILRKPFTSHNCIPACELQCIAILKTLFLYKGAGGARLHRPKLSLAWPPPPYQKKNKRSGHARLA